MAKKKEPKVVVKGLEDVLRSIEQEFGVGSIQKFDSKKSVAIESFSTGSLQLDLALGIGGVPRGRVVEIYGPESSGKTTVCQHIIASAQKSTGMPCAFVDTEHAIDPAYMKRTGVDMSNIYISQPDCGEDALNITEKLIRSGAFAVVVVDSVAALVPRAEIEGQMGDSHVGLQARLMSQALRKITGPVAQSNTCLIFTNQIRLKIGVMFGNPETTAGGNALKFYASIRMDIRRSTTLKDATGEPIGNSVKVKVVKNKLAPPFRKAEFEIIYPNGISYERGLVDLALEHDVIQKRGSWYNYGTDQIGQGREQAISTICEDKKLFEKLKGEVMSAITKAGEGETEAE